MRIPLPSIPLGSVAGTPTALHFSVLLLVLVVAAEAEFTGQQAVLFGLAVLASLVMHLLIHLALSRWAELPEPPRGIALMPFGEVGMARWRPSGADISTGSLPVPPIENSVSLTKGAMAILAPSGVHLATAAAIWCFAIEPYAGPPIPFAYNQMMHLFVIQASLGLINLLPLEPLDMGRLFRFLSQQRASTGALSSLSLIRSGQLITLGIGLLSLWLGPFSLFFLCLMILSASMQIVMEETALLAAAGMSAREVMRPAQRVDSFTHGVTISAALRIAQSSFQDVFPVILQGRIIGLVDRRTLLSAAAHADKQEQLVAELASPPAQIVNLETPVSEVLAGGSPDGAAVVVSTENTFEGIILPEHLSDVLIVGAIRKEEPPEDPPEMPY